MLIGANELRQLNPASALQFVDMYVQNRTADFDARQMRAALSAQMGYYDRFADDAEMLVRLDDNRAAAYLWHGLAQLLRGKADEALRDLNRADELRHDSPWPSVLRGLALLQLSRAPEAIAIFTRVIELSPNLVLAQLGRAAAYAATGSLLNAVKDLTGVLAIDSKDADALTMRGDYYAALGRYADATKDFEDAMAITGETPALFFRLMLVRSQHSTQAGQAPSLELPPGTPADSDADASAPEVSNGTSSRLSTDWLNRLSSNRPAPRPSKRVASVSRGMSFRGGWP
jgi:tetratricopeptide (TPR) repeat protein